MKTFLFLSFLLCVGGLKSQVVSNPSPADELRKIQIAILFDTSGSMSGLIEQAKTTIWQIVNAAARLKMDGKSPRLEIALYDYGNSTISTHNWIRKQVDLISDLDSISEKLFTLSTNGGDEYCAAVIQSAMKDLQWSTNPRDLKLIYIAGNEPFNQGPINYKEILSGAANQNIVVNTIYCGPYDQGVRELWYDGAIQSQGNYFNIDSNKDAFHVDTPYDQEIQYYNDSLNSTYMGYGSYGMLREQKQKEEDANAFSKGAANVSERAVSKAQAYYSNKSWDIIDAKKDQNFRLDSIPAADLPKELQGKTTAEQEKIIGEKTLKRQHYQQKINELNGKRSDFIEQEKQKQAADKGVEDLGTSIIKSMNTSANKIGYNVE